MDIPPKPVELCEQADFCTGTQHWRRHPGNRLWCQLRWSYASYSWCWTRVVSPTIVELLDVYERELQEKRISIET